MISWDGMFCLAPLAPLSSRGPLERDSIFLPCPGHGRNFNWGWVAGAVATALDTGPYAPIPASAQLPTNQVTLGNSTSQKFGFSFCDPCLTPVGVGVSTREGVLHLQRAILWVMLLWVHPKDTVKGLRAVTQLYFSSFPMVIFFKLQV